MYLAQEPQRSDAGVARTRCPSVSSQALYHWASIRSIKSLIAMFVDNFLIFIFDLVGKITIYHIHVCN